MPSGGRLKAGNGLIQERGDVRRAQVEAELSGLGLCQLAQVVYQAAQEAGLVVEARDLALFQWIDVVQDSAQVALQDAEGRAQFMGNVRHQVLAQFLCLAQRCRHFVKSLRHLDEFVTALLLDLLAQIARGNGLRGGNQALQSSSLGRPPQT